MLELCQIAFRNAALAALAALARSTIMLRCYTKGQVAQKAAGKIQKHLSHLNVRKYFGKDTT